MFSYILGKVRHGGKAMGKMERGFIAGVIAAIPMNIWSFISYNLLKFTEIRFLDWAAIFLFGTLPKSGIQVAMGLVFHFLWAGFLGTIFAYIFPETNARWYVGKAVIYSLLVAFFQYAISVLYSIPNLKILPTTTVISNHIGGIIWGFTLGWVSKWLVGREVK